MTKGVDVWKGYSGAAKFASLLLLLGSSFFLGVFMGRFLVLRGCCAFVLGRCWRRAGVLHPDSLFLSLGSLREVNWLLRRDLLWNNSVGSPTRAHQDILHWSL